MTSLQIYVFLSMSTRVDGIMMFTMIEQILDKSSQKVNGQTRLLGVFTSRISYLKNTTPPQS